MEIFANFNRNHRFSDIFLSKNQNTLMFGVCRFHKYYKDLYYMISEVQTSETSTPSLMIGYYPLRGKAQICRLLCEYLNIPYKDLLFTPKTWEEFKFQQNLDWTFQQLPFMKEGDLVVTQTYPMCLYIIYKSNSKFLLGSNVSEEIKIDSQVWKTDPVSYLFTSLLNHRDLTVENKKDATEKLWQRYLNNKLAKLQEQAYGQFFFQNITLLDFYIYETFYTLYVLCPQRMSSFPKLMRIFETVGNLEAIKNYEKSNRTIKEVCPVKFCINWRSKCCRVSN